jgi:membrane protein DedA with SNARE-associated domain
MTEWIVNTMNSLGYLGIGLLMFLENLFPPIPSELIMPLAGYTASLPDGKLQLVPSIAAGVIGTVLGAFPWYFAGSMLGADRLESLTDRFGKWIGVSGKDIVSSKQWFEKYGNRGVLFGRLVPVVRTLISIPAGIARMQLPAFVVYSTVGTAIWTTFLTSAGFMLGKNYTLVDEYLTPVSKIVLVILIVAAIAFIANRILKKQKNKSRQDLD